jgi:hypothetical protein
MINTGFMIVKNSQFSLDFLDKVYNNIYDPLASGERYQNWEQGSFIHLYDNNFLNCKERIKVTDPIELNSYWFNFYMGHFVIHFAGVRGDTLGDVLKKYYPGILPNDTQETYDTRMNWLRKDMRKESDHMLIIERENQMKEVENNARKNSDVKLFTNEEINNIKKSYEIFIDRLKSICTKHNMYTERDEDNRYNNILSVCSKESVIIQIGGFKSGMTTLMFLIANKNNKVFCFDTLDKCSLECYEYIQSIFPPDRLVMYNGVSFDYLGKFKETYDIQADVISIYSLEPRFVNINFFTTLELSKKDGVLILHENGTPPISSLWNGYIRDGHIKQMNILPVPFQGHTMGRYLRDQNRPTKKPTNIYTKENVNIFKLKLSQSTFCVSSKVSNKKEEVDAMISKLKKVRETYKDKTICLLEHTVNLEETYQHTLAPHCDFLILLDDDHDPTLFVSLNKICSMFIDSKINNHWSSL